MKIPQGIFLKAYAGMLSMYPENFRAKYRAQLEDAARLQYEEHGQHGNLAARLTGDTVKGALRETMRFPGANSTFSFIGFAALFTFLLLCLYVGMQQTWRRGADNGPKAVVQQIRGGDGSLLVGDAQEISTPAWLNGRHTFAATYNAQGAATASDARLHGALPQPPRGIFKVMRQRGEYSVTWQPEPGVRVALTGATLPQGGFAVAGQSLTPGENKTVRFGAFVLFLWGLMLAALGLSTVAFRRRPAN